MTAACPACSVATASVELAHSPAQRFSLPTIHCAACIGKIERCLNGVKGVTNARVNLSMKQLQVTGPVEPEMIVNALAKIGFEAFPLNIEALEKTHDKSGTALLIRMAVAGFAMMNVMLLSVAVWSGAQDTTREIFHMISALVAVSAVSYAAQPFFQNAWTALRHGQLNMDVPISLAILLATGMSLFETLNGGKHVYFDAAVSLTFFLLIGRYLDHTTRKTARSAAKELTALEVRRAQRLTKGGRIEDVAVSALAVGDTLLIASGARIPVDGMLQSDSALLDRSFLTGENAAVEIAQGDMLQAGEINLGNPFDMQATAVGEDTSLRKMASFVETAENSRNSYTALADKAARIYAPMVHLLALAAFVGWMFATGDVRHSLNIAIAVLIITCPCALGLAVPAVTTAAISKLFSNGFLVKHATALERIADVDYIVFDKTGTLTTPSARIPKHWTDLEKSIALALAQASNHPLSRALVRSLHGVTPATVSDLKEISGMGVSAIWNRETVALGQGSWLGAEFHGLGFKHGQAPADPIEITEVPRSGVDKMLSNIKIPSELMTGDTDLAAETFATPFHLSFQAQARPMDKMDRINALAAQGYHTLMFGDGLNDTSALASAHASMAPSSALEASRNAADVVILDPDFKNIPLIFKVATATRRISKQNFAIAAAYNAVAIPIALAGFATPLMAALAMSLSSITVILNSFRLRSLK